MTTAAKTSICIGLLFAMLFGPIALHAADDPHLTSAPANVLDVTKAPPVSVADQKANNLLDKHLPEARFDAVALGDVVDFLRDITGANIFVNWKALQAVGIDKKAPVTARLRDVSFRKALQTILADAGGGTVKLGFAVDEGIITITTDEDLSKNTQTRVYDVRDFLVEPVEPQATAEARAKSRQVLVDATIKLIQETVAPDSWMENGGTVGRISELSGQLIITQTPGNQEEIQTLLHQLRETRSIQLVIETRFLKTSEETMKAAGVSLEDYAQQPDKKPGTFIDDAKLRALMQASQADQNSTLITAPRLTLFNGQRATVNVEREEQYIAGFTAVVKRAGETRYEPQMQQVHPGLSLDLNATCSADRKFVTVSGHAQHTTLVAMTKEKWAGSDAQDLMVQKPALDILGANLTVSIPLGQTLVVPLLAHEGNPVPGVDDAAQEKPVNAAQPGIAGEKSGQRTILLIKPTVIWQLETDQKLTPMLSAPAR